MCATIDNVNEEKPGKTPDNTGRGKTLYGTCYYSDSLLDAVQSGLLFFDSDGIVFRINTMARQDLYLPDDAEGHRLVELISTDFRGGDILPELLSRFDVPEIRQVLLPQDTLLCTKDSKAAFFAAGQISRLEQGCFVFSYRNVLNEMTNEYMIKMALSVSKIFPWFYDFEQGKMIIDRRYFDYTGIPTEDNSMTLEAYSERLPPDDRAAMAHAFTLQLNGQHYPYPVPFRLRRGDGTYEWFEGQSTYLGQIKNMPYRIVGICMSTQAHKNIEEALTAAKEKAEQSDRLKSAFLANMSHEIRTPLNAIVGFSNLLTAGDADTCREEAQEYAALISKNCDYLITLVTDILDLSRIETGAMEYCVAEHSLFQILSDIYKKYADRLPAGVKLNLLLPPDDIRITTDALRLRQVIEHLVGNAAKFTAKGHVDLGCTSTDEGEGIRLFISDTGCGIPTDLTEKIFDRFYQIDSFKQGAGLGLSVCKTIIEGMGGRIAVSSRPGKGSRFTVKIPVTPKK